MTECKLWRPLFLLTALLLVVGNAGAANLNKVASTAARIRHVFIIVLENSSFEDTFGTSRQDPYLQKTLVPAGALLTEYYGTGHVSLDNYISIISGQAPTRDTANDCMQVIAGAPGSYFDVEQIGTSENEQVVARGGCIYPDSVKTFADQLDSSGFRWRAYMEDMGNDGTREAATCGHPRIGIGTDETNTAEAPSAAVPQGDAYATRHNPFMYFHSIIDSPKCSTNVVGLQQLSSDLAQKSKTPNLVFVTPNLCHDGHDGDGTGVAGTTCNNGEPGGLTSADAFLHTWVPRILASSAYKDDGLLIITFDESAPSVSESINQGTGQTVVNLTFSGQSCCNQRPGPNLEGFRPGKVTLINTPALVQNIITNGYGGDRIGALLLSPFVRAGSTSTTPYNHYSLLRSLEDIFGIQDHLGYAADNPATGYHVDDIGNDESIFKSAASP